MGHGDTALEQQLLPIAVAQGKAIGEPDPVADDLAGEAVILVAFGVSRWRHVGCLSGGRLGLRGVIVVGIMSRAGKNGQQLDNAFRSASHRGIQRAPKVAVAHACRAWQDCR